MLNNHLHVVAEQIYPFDARGIAKRFRHAAIFGALDALTSGETMRFMNDHDPLPLLHQIDQHTALPGKSHCTARTGLERVCRRRLASQRE